MRLFPLLTKLALSVAILSQSFSAFAEPVPPTVLSAIHQVESQWQARVGVSVLNENTDTSWQYHGDQRFPLTSTFKALACAAALHKGGMETKMPILASELDSYAPVTKDMVGKDMTIQQLCQATMTWSDNTAANVVLKYLGGPEYVTKFMRKIGDNTTQLSRWEPELNEGKPGDVRDTTTPNAINQTLQTLLYGDELSKQNQVQLLTWLEGDKVANDLLRSVLPDGWKIGDRTGAGGYGSRGIISVLLPPQQKPIFVSIYVTETQSTLAERNAMIAKIGKAIIEALPEK